MISGTTKTMAYSEIKNCQTVNLPEGISLLIFNLSNLGYHSYEHFRVYRVYLLWISLEYSSVKIFQNIPKKSSKKNIPAPKGYSIPSVIFIEGTPHLSKSVKLTGLVESRKS